MTAPLVACPRANTSSDCASERIENSTSAATPARSEKNHWSLGVLTSDEKLARQSANLVPNFRTQNGGIPVTFFTTDEAVESE